MFVLSSPSGAGKSTLARLLLRRRRTSSCRSPSPRGRGARARWRAGTTISSTSRRSRACGSTASCWNRRKCTAISTARRARRWRRRWRAAATSCSISTGRARSSFREIEATRGDLVRVFVLPPNFHELKARLERRAEDAPETISAAALERHRAEIGKWTEYDYVIINEDLDRSFPMVRAIPAGRAHAARARHRARRLRRRRSLREADDGGSRADQPQPWRKARARRRKPSTGHILGAERRRDAGVGEDGLRGRPRAASGLSAASCAAGRRRRRLPPRALRPAAAPRRRAARA